MHPTELPPPIDPAFVTLQRDIFHQAVHDLCAILPTLPGEPYEDRERRCRTAIDCVASLAPVNADEADLAVHYVATSAHAKEYERLSVCQATDTSAVIKLNAQSTNMMRQSRAYRSLLLRVQAVRYKRETDDKTREQDAWSAHRALGWMTEALEDLFCPQPAAAMPKPAPQSAPNPAPAPVGAHKPAPVPVAAMQPSQTAAPPRNAAAPSTVQTAIAADTADIKLSDAEMLKLLEGMARDRAFNPLDSEFLAAIGDSTAPRERDSAASAGQG